MGISLGFLWRVRGKNTLHNMFMAQARWEFDPPKMPAHLLLSTTHIMSHRVIPNRVWGRKKNQIRKIIFFCKHVYFEKCCCCKAHKDFHIITKIIVIVLMNKQLTWKLLLTFFSIRVLKMELTFVQEKLADGSSIGCVNLLSDVPKVKIFMCSPSDIW